jgi:hypothetical protein
MQKQNGDDADEHRLNIFRVSPEQMKLKRREHEDRREKKLVFMRSKVPPV